MVGVDRPTARWRRPARTFVPVGLAGMLACWFAYPVAPGPESLRDVRLVTLPGTLLFFLCLGAVVAGIVLLAARLSRWPLVLACAVLALLVVAGNVLSIPIATDVAKIAFAAVVGAAIARGIERPWWLVPACVLVPIADAWSVLSERGVTNRLLERAREDPRPVEWLTLVVPAPGIEMRLGVVDVLFLGLFVAVAHRWRMGWLRAALLLPVTFTLSYLVVYELQRAVPALPLLCLGFLAVFARSLAADARHAWRDRDVEYPSRPI